MLNFRYIILNKLVLFCVTVLILLIFSVSNVSITQINNPFYIITSLPFTYWIGISIIIYLIILLYKTYNYNIYSNYLLLLIVCLYLYGIPSIIMENPRFMDVYMHSGMSISINKTYGIEEFRYSREYPHSFIWFAILLSITHINALFLLKILGILLPLIGILIMHEILKYINPKYALLGSLAFSSLFFTDQGHFSPQAMALIFVFSLIYILTKLLSKNNAQWQYIILLILFVIVINITNPTTTLIVNTILIGYLINIYIQRKNYKHFILLNIIFLILWSIYNAKSTTQEIIYRVNDLLFNLGNPSKVVLRTNPHPIYLYFNLTQYVLAISTIISGIVLVILIFIKRCYSLTYYPFVITAFIVLCSLLPLSLFEIGEATNTFLQRLYLFILISWVLLMSISLSYGVINKFGKRFLIVLTLVSLAVFPLTKYGGDFVNYVPSSLLYTASITPTDSSLLIYPPLTFSQPFIYESVIHDNYDIVTARLKYYNYTKDSLEQNLTSIIASKQHELLPNLLKHINIAIKKDIDYRYYLIHQDRYFIYNLRDTLSNTPNINKIIDATSTEVFHKQLR